MNTKTQSTKKVVNKVATTKQLVNAKKLAELKEKNAIEKVALIDKVTNDLSTKQVGDKVVKPSKKLINSIVTKERLTNKAEKNAFDFVLLANATIKVDEFTNINKLYNKLKFDFVDECTNILGGFEFPTFAQFKEKLPIKFTFSTWDGLNTIYKFNLNAQRKERAKKQQEKVNAI
jgi:hypothetical protein